MRILTRRGQPYEYHDTETGRDLFSVTQVRNVLYNPYAELDPRMLEAARLRGSVMHHRFFLAVANVSGAEPEYPARIEQYGGYCDSMDRWIEEVRPRGLKLETKGLNLETGHAGQVDALLWFERHRMDDVNLGDLKTGQVNPTDPVQVTAYSTMEGFKSKGQFLLYLDRDGGPARECWVKRTEHGAHWASFMNALSVLRWRRRYAK